MIGRLRGPLIWRGADQVMIEAGGVGYLVLVSERTMAGLPQAGEAVLYTEMVVREDLMQLIGFASMEERDWHRLLQSVQGVGARAALAILGALGTEGVARAIALDDAKAIRSAQGVGPKLAQRVVNELKDKAAALAHPAGMPGARTAPAPGAPAGGAEAGALSALTNLGYAPVEASRAVAEAAADGAADEATLIRAALQLLAPKG